MNTLNHTSFAKAVSVVSIFSLFIIAFGILPPLVNAENPQPSVVTLELDPGDNIASFRDTTNVFPTSSTVNVDTSSIKAGFFTIIVEDKDANLDRTSLDVILSGATSTSSDQDIVETILTETGVDTGTFSGPVSVGLGPTTEDTLEVGLADALSIFYEGVPPAVGRALIEVNGLTDSGIVQIQDSNFRETPSIDEFSSTCEWDLYTHTVDVRFSGVTPDPDEITVTISYANTNLAGNNNVNGKNFEDLEVVYRGEEGIAFKSLTSDLSGHNKAKKTITSQLSPQQNIFGDNGLPFLTNGNGQYALGVDLGSCSGGGGGGLVRPGLVVNALAGSGAVLALFGGGSGGGANPTFGDASLMVLEDIAEGFGGTISEGDDISLDSTKVVNTGDTVVMRFNLYENQGITNLERFIMYLNFEGENYDASTIDTHITYQRGGEITIVDPHEKIENAKIEILQVDPWNLIVNAQIIFKNPFNTSILVDSWDLDRNSGKKLFPDALQVEESSVLLADTQIELETTELSLTTTEDLAETPLTEIPVWVKSNALWWKQKQIDDSDFMAGIKYLVQKTIIEIDKSELSTSATSSEIPVWIRDVAGMWADYSITDEEFVNAMKWLLSNGILEVQQ